MYQLPVKHNATKCIANLTVHVTTCWISCLVSRSKDTSRGWCPPI